jgi:peptidyl-prolyl cis-trans isomerase C
MKLKLLPVIIGTLLTAACNPKEPTTAAPPVATPQVDKADAVASVNGYYIPKSALETLEKEVAERSHGQSFPKEKLIEELIQRELLVQDAVQKKLDQTPDVISQIEMAKKTLLTQADLQDYLKANPVTDEEVKAEYDKQLGGDKRMEYKARHILVKTEKAAKERISELDKGADFAKLANKYSLDAKESQNGGDLGWFPPEQMVAPFSEAIKTMAKGKYTKTPVQTQFGWHVILLEDSREQTPPPFDAVKDQLKPFLQRKKIQTLLEGLRKQAKVEILVPLVEEKPAAQPSASAPAGEPAKEGASAEAVQPVPVPPAAPAEAEKPAEAAPAAEPKPAEPKPAEPGKP